MDELKTASQQREAISFGPFRLVISERRFETASGPVRLGGRAFDILVFLIERAGEIVSKQDLLDRVWSDVTVEESSLRVHIAALRKALSNERTEDRYVATVAGRGYCFVAPITRSILTRPPPRTRMPGGTETLPSVLKSIVAQGDAVDEPADVMPARLVEPRRPSPLEQLEAAALNAGMALIDSVRPRSDIEVQLAVQIVAAGMSGLRLLRQDHRHIINGYIDVCGTYAARLLGLQNELVRTLDRQRRGNGQKVEARNVRIRAGGQEVAGIVDTPQPGGEDRK